MSKHGENIYKRKDGRYEGRYIIGRTSDGRTKFGYVYAYTFAETRGKLLLKKAAQLTRPADGCPQRGRTLGEWLGHWMESELLGSVRASTYQTYLNQINRYLIPALGHYPLAKITPSDVHAFVISLQNRGLAASTRRSIYGLLVASMRFAFEEGVILQNPCRRIRVQPGEGREQCVLTRAEQALLRQATPNERNLPILLSLYTGMRLGEVCALKWLDIDWENGTIAVRRTAQRVAQIGPRDGSRTLLMIGLPKSQRSQRVLPVPEFLLQSLRELMSTAQGSQPYVFGRENGVAEPRTIQRRFQRFAQQLCIKDVHFHTLRHTFATRLLELGVDVKTVSILLGHGSAKTTLDFYAHSLIEQQRLAVDRLALC